MESLWFSFNIWIEKYDVSIINVVGNQNYVLVILYPANYFYP